MPHCFCNFCFLFSKFQFFSPFASHKFENRKRSVNKVTFFLLCYNNKNISTENEKQKNKLNTLHVFLQAKPRVCLEGSLLHMKRESAELIVFPFHFIACSWNFFYLQLMRFPPFVVHGLADFNLIFGTQCHK